AGDCCRWTGGAGHARPEGLAGRQAPRARTCAALVAWRVRLWDRREPEPRLATLLRPDGVLRRAADRAGRRSDHRGGPTDLVRPALAVAPIRRAAAWSGRRTGRVEDGDEHGDGRARGARSCEK